MTHFTCQNLLMADVVICRLDVAQHMSLCRHYVRELRRSVLIGTPDIDKSSKRSSQILENMGDLEPRAAGPSMYTSEKEKDQDAQMSAFLREEQQAQDSPHSGSGRIQRPSPQFSQSHDVTTDSNSPAHAVARADITNSAQKILYTFLLPGAEREITLPDTITHDITYAIEQEGRDDPEVFDVAKDYVFQAMERDAFPGFLRMKALGNLIPPTIIMRLIIGLIAMFGAFWAAFVLIFLEESRQTRCWVRFSSRESYVADRQTACSAFYRRRLLPRLISVFFRSSHGPDRIQRVHALQLLPHSRALRAQASGQASAHGSGNNHARRCGTLCTLHSRSRETTLSSLVFDSSCHGARGIAGFPPSFLLISSLHDLADSCLRPFTIPA